LISWHSLNIGKRREEERRRGGWEVQVRHRPRREERICLHHRWHEESVIHDVKCYRSWVTFDCFADALLWKFHGLSYAPHGTTEEAREEEGGGKDEERGGKRRRRERGEVPTR
jgi:hypothetical protein